MGALDELQPDERVLERSLELASKLAALPRAAYPIVKRQLRGGTLERIEQVLSGEHDPFAASWLGDEAADASAAILNRDS
jgi:enoyl-CoA hydratase/carnithine racemase